MTAKSKDLRDADNTPIDKIVQPITEQQQQQGQLGQCTRCECVCTKCIEVEVENMNQGCVVTLVGFAQLTCWRVDGRSESSVLQEEDEEGGREGWVQRRK